MTSPHEEFCSSDCRCYRAGRAEELAHLTMKAIELEARYGENPPWQSIIFLEWPVRVPSAAISQHGRDLLNAHPEWGIKVDPALRLVEED